LFGVDNVNDWEKVGKNSQTPHTAKRNSHAGLAGTTNQEAINVRLLGQLAAVLLVDAAAIQDPRVFGSFCRQFLGEELAEGGVNLLRLFRSGDFASADGPVGESEQYNGKGGSWSVYQMGS